MNNAETPTSLKQPKPLRRLKRRRFMVAGEVLEYGDQYRDAENPRKWWYASSSLGESVPSDDCFKRQYRTNRPPHDHLRPDSKMILGYTNTF